jgi:tetratricopeptide (TPR) repeat protein
LSTFPATPSPGSAVTAASRGPLARELLKLARECAGKGVVDDAAGGYDAAILAAEREGDLATFADALRLRAVLHHHRNEPERAGALAERSRLAAVEVGSTRLEAEALNVLGGLQLEAGRLDAARAAFLHALDRAGNDWQLWARIEQNLGIVANVRGDRALARWHYLRSLRAYRRAHDRHGCAIALHNLGMLSADRARWRKAERQFEMTRDLAREAADSHLEALALLNSAEVKLGLGQPELAETRAQESLRIFEELGSTVDLADAWKTLGLASRRLGRPGAAESRLRTALELAASTGNALTRAEATLALGELYLEAGRRRDAVASLGAAWRLFAALGAKLEPVRALERLYRLEEEYIASLEDALAFAIPGARARAVRTAQHAADLARALGLDPIDESAARVGAYLCVADRGTDDCPWSVADVVRRARARSAGSLALAPEDPVLVHILSLAALYDELTEPDDAAHRLSSRAAAERIGELGAGAVSPRVMEAFRRAACRFVAG